MTRPLFRFELFARLVLAAAYLSACADRFGLWGPSGTPGVDWGSMGGFYSATAVLVPYAPESLIPLVAWVATLLELGLAGLLLAGIQLKWTSLASGILLLVFAISMTMYLGPKFPLNYSVFTASACSLLLYGLASQRKPHGARAED